MFPSSAQDPKSGAPLRILMVSDDPELVETRRMLFQHAGLSPAVLSSYDVQHGAPLSGYDVYLICQSLDPALTFRVTNRIRSADGHARILRIRNRLPDTDHVANLYLQPPIEPADLIRSIGMLTTTFPRPSN